jgi:PAS domain S-box-containing protein
VIEGSPETRTGDESTLGAASLYRLLVDSVRDYAIFVLDPAGRVKSWNPGARRIKGYAEDEIIGRHYRVFYPEDVRDTDPDAQLEIARRVGRFEGEGWRVRKDGSRFWAHVVITALYDGDTLVGFGKVTGDKTAEHQAQQLLKNRERQLAEAQQIAHLGSWEWDIDGDVVTWSDELSHIYGVVSRPALDYHDFLQLVHPEDRDHFHEAIRRSIESGAPFVREHRIARPGGEVRWLQSRGEPIPDDEGRAVRVVGTALDITELKDA